MVNYQVFHNLVSRLVKNDPNARWKLSSSGALHPPTISVAEVAITDLAGAAHRLVPGQAPPPPYNQLYPGPIIHQVDRIEVRMDVRQAERNNGQFVLQSNIWIDSTAGALFIFHKPGAFNCADELHALIGYQERPRYENLEDSIARIFYDSHDDIYSNYVVNCIQHDHESVARRMVQQLASLAQSMPMAGMDGRTISESSPDGTAVVSITPRASERYSASDNLCPETETRCPSGSGPLPPTTPP